MQPIIESLMDMSNKMTACNFILTAISDTLTRDCLITHSGTKALEFLSDSLHSIIDSMDETIEELEQEVS